MTSVPDPLQRIRDQIEFGDGVGKLSDIARDALRAFAPRLIVLLDVLGFTALSREMSTDERIRDLAVSALRELSTQASWQFDHLGVAIDRRVTCFSDMIVVSYPACPFDIGPAIQDVRWITIRMAALGLAVRGAVVKGMLYHTPGSILGEGLVVAHEMERCVAKHPRVVVSPSTVREHLGLAEDADERMVDGWLDELRDIHEGDDTGTRSTLESLRRDADGQFFVDHLSPALWPPGANFPVPDERPAYLDVVHRMITHQLSQLASVALSEEVRESQRRKWKWYAAYYNAVVQRFGVGTLIGG